MKRKMGGGLDWLCCITPIGLPITGLLSTDSVQNHRTHPFLCLYSLLHHVGTFNIHSKHISYSFQKLFLNSFSGKQDGNDDDDVKTKCQPAFGLKALPAGGKQSQTNLLCVWKLHCCSAQGSLLPSGQCLFSSEIR